jgi:pectate lyase
MFNFFRFLLLVAATCANVGPPSTAALPAFPGAAGFGAETIGGRGGRLIAVTTLADSGPGSLREALLAPEPRIVIFRVAGTIELKTRISLGPAQSFLTLAGQTAPGEGVQVKGFDVFVDGAHDLVIRYMRFRPGNTGPLDSSKHSLLLYGTKDAKAYNIVIDHCSLYWGPDETAGAWEFVENVTWQWNISEGMVHDTCPPTPAPTPANPNPQPSPCTNENSKSYLLGTSNGNGAAQKNMTLHHNFMVNAAQRNPAIASDGPHHVVNNLIYNWQDFGTAISNRGAGAKVNLIGNVYVRGPVSSTSRYAVALEGSTTNPDQYVYVSDNIGPFRTNDATDAWAIVGNGYDTSRYWLTPLPTNFRRATPWPDSPIPVVPSPSAQVIADVLNDVGATRPVRDALDQRAVADFYNRTGSIKRASRPQEMVYPVLASAAAPLDTDGDGMPDEWEIRYGLNPNDPRDGNRDANGDGYTNIEEYLNNTDPTKQKSAIRNVRVPFANIAAALLRP